MPLDFAENEKPRAPVEFFITNTKARPLDLEGEVLPELIRRVRPKTVRSSHVSFQALCAPTPLPPLGLTDVFLPLYPAVW